MEAALAQIAMPQGSGNLLFLCLGKAGAERALGEGHIRYAGVEPDPFRMACYYQASDVYIHAALGEAFGKTVTEAMACGTPVVTTAVDGIPEQVEDGVTGFLVPPSQAQRLGPAAQQLLTDSALHGRMSRAGVARVVQRFSLDRQVREFLGWYEEVLEDWSQWKSREAPTRGSPPVRKMARWSRQAVIARNRQS